MLYIDLNQILGYGINLCLFATHIVPLTIPYLMVVASCSSAPNLDGLDVALD